MDKGSVSSNNDNFATIQTITFAPTSQNEAIEFITTQTDLTPFQAAELLDQGFLPLHIVIQWGSGARDLDLHLTGPSGDTRFHIYWNNKGTINASPSALLIDDCSAPRCAEVIRIDNFEQEGIYRASVFNFGDSNPASDNLSSKSGVTLELIRGGNIVEVTGFNDTLTIIRNGNKVINGDLLFSGSPTPGQVGNTWTAVEIDSKTSDIDFVNQITNSVNSAAVQ